MEVHAVRDILAAKTVGAEMFSSGNGAVASSSSSSSGKTVFTDINQMIYNKEKELKEFQDMKCSNLEKLVIERDILLIESNKRFEQMKKDFKYNLTLLEVRDKEIERLEKLVEEKGALLLANELDRKSLYDKIVILESKEDQLCEKYDREKGHYRRVLEEMKEAIEGMKWAALEDGKAKAREIDVLKEDLGRVMLSRDESLDSQRKDLTQTFEQLLCQREQSFCAKEKELVNQLASFGAKHEQLQKEIGQLKSELFDCSRQREGLVEELTRKDELYRQLQWRIEDERSARQGKEDELQREVQQLSIELSSIKEQLLNDSNDYKRRLEGAAAEAAREKSFRLAADARFEANKQQLSSDLQRLASELAGIKEREAGFEGGLKALRAERDAAEARAGALRGENEAVAAARRSLERELASAQAAIKGLSEQLAQERASMGVLREYAEELKQELRYASKSSDEYAAKQGKEERMIIEAKYEAEKTINRLENSCHLLEGERDRLVTEARAAGALLEEERAEAAAVALRLRLCEGQLVSLQQQLSQQRRDAVHFIDQNNQIGVESPSPAASRHRSDRRVAGMSSPVFSDDLGPASLPASPQAAHSPRHRYAVEESSPADVVNSSAYSDSTHYDSHLMAENERLRAVIKDMRLHMDALQAQQLAVEGGATTAAAAAAVVEKDAKIAALGERLQETVAEVQRLRSERRKLMDVGNELRAALRSRDAAEGDEEGRGYPLALGRRAAVAWTDDNYNPADRYALQAVQAAQVGLPMAISASNPPVALPRSSVQEGIRIEGQPIKALSNVSENGAATNTSTGAGGMAVTAVTGSTKGGVAVARQRRDKILLADSVRRKNYGLVGSSAAGDKP